MKEPRTYLVREVARLAGVSVRALHHYEQIGLLIPARRTAAGYRLYGEGDLRRLQQILIGRALGLSLEAIRRGLDEPGFDRRRALLGQRAALMERAAQAARMIKAVDRALAEIDGDEVEGDEVKDLFDGFDPAEHEDEARERWGETDAFKESARRTRGYGAREWAQIKEEQQAIYGELCALMVAGVSADDEAAMDAAERHKRSIDRWFYPCSAAMHAGLADLFESDARFSNNINKSGDGLAAFMAAAIRANARREGG